MAVSLAFRVEAAIARALIWGLRALGPVRASNAGGALLRWAGPLLPVSRVADTNLRLAFPDMDAAARRRIALGAWESLGRTVAEMPHIAALRATPSGPGWEIAGDAIMRRLQAEGGPAIFFSGHLGNWEVLPRASASYGVVLSGMYRAAANPLIDTMILSMRQDAVGAQMRMFPKGAAGARGALAHLRAGGVLAMLMDQKMNDGIEARLFGQPAMTAPAMAALALRFGCPVIPAYAERIGPARFRLVCETPLPLPDSGDRQADILALTQAVNDCLERWIRSRPESWLWMHRRFPKPLYR
jgi:KDO2-lipid IV(A) lauroyltransferase